MAAQYSNGAEIVAAVNVLNYVVGAVGTLVKFSGDSALGTAGRFADIVALTNDMKDGKVALLFVHGTNPAHSLPGAFQQALGKVGYKVSFSSYMDETTAACDLVLPDHHPLEQWGESRPRAGVVAFQQPVVQPVFFTRQTGDVILKLAGKTGTFKDRVKGKLADQPWVDALAKGGIYTETAAATRAAAARLAPSIGSINPAVPANESGCDQTGVVFPHPVPHGRRGAPPGSERGVHQPRVPRERVRWRSDRRRLPASGTARRPRREQAVAPGAARSRLEDRVAQLGGSASRHGRSLGRRDRRLPAAQVGLWRAEIPGMDHALRPARRPGRPDGAGTHRLRALREGPLGERVRAARRPGESVRGPHLQRARHGDEDG